MAIAAIDLAVVDPEAKLRGNDRLVAAAFQGLTEQLFILKRSIDFGGVEECKAEFKRTVNGCDRLCVVRNAVSLAHAHAAETQGGYFQSLLCEFSLLQHTSCPLLIRLRP